MSMMQKRPRPLSASLLAPKGAARPAQPLDQQFENAGASTFEHSAHDQHAAAPAATAATQGEGRTLFDVPAAPKPVPKFGKKQTLPPQTASNEHDAGSPVDAVTLDDERYDSPVYSAGAPDAPTYEAPVPDQQAEELIEMPRTTGAKKAAFTFRMCEKRHFRLRLLSAHQNRSSQKILEAALDDYLETHAPQTAGMACHCFEGAGSS
jgi:hypothetical protein